MSLPVPSTMPRADAARDAVLPLRAHVAVLEAGLAHLVRQITGEDPRPHITWSDLRARRWARTDELRTAAQALAAAERIAAAWTVSPVLGPLVERYEVLRVHAAELVCEEGEARLAIAREMQALQLDIDRTSTAALSRIPRKGDPT